MLYQQDGKTLQRGRESEEDGDEEEIKRDGRGPVVWRAGRCAVCPLQTGSGEFYFYLDTWVWVSLDEQKAPFSACSRTGVGPLRWSLRPSSVRAHKHKQYVARHEASLHSPPSSSHWLLKMNSTFFFVFEIVKDEEVVMLTVSWHDKHMNEKTNNENIAGKWQHFNFFL